MWRIKCKATGLYLNDYRNGLVCVTQKPEMARLFSTYKKAAFMAEVMQILAPSFDWCAASAEQAGIEWVQREMIGC